MKFPLAKTICYSCSYAVENVILLVLCFCTICNETQLSIGYWLFNGSTLCIAKLTAWDKQLVELLIQILVLSFWIFADGLMVIVKLNQKQILLTLFEVGFYLPGFFIDKGILGKQKWKPLRPRSTMLKFFIFCFFCSWSLTL